MPENRHGPDQIPRHSPQRLRLFDARHRSTPPNPCSSRARQQARPNARRSAQAEGEQLKEASPQIQGLPKGYAAGPRRGLAKGKKAGHAAGPGRHSARHDAAHQLALTEAVQQLDDGRDQLQTNAITKSFAWPAPSPARSPSGRGIWTERVMCENLKEALSLAVHAADVRIAVHPSQLKTLQA